MIFLAATAIYALHSPSRATAGSSTIAAMSDRALTTLAFAYEDLTFSGIHNTPRSRAIIEALGLPYSGSILSFDTADAHDELMKVGWIEAAEVRRALPSRP